MDFLKNLTQPAVRSWIYGVATAAASAVTVWGVATEDQVSGAMGIIAAVLAIGGNGLAFLNRPTKSDGKHEA